MPYQVRLIHIFRTVIKMIFISLKNQTLIFNNGLDGDMKHGGRLWTCSSCLNKEGMLAGYSKKEDFLSNHEDCTLFMEDVLSDSEKKGWGKHMDHKARQGPFGRPEGHVWTGKTETLVTRKAAKTTPVLQQDRYILINLERLSRNRSYDFSLNVSSESVNEKIRKVLKLSSSEKIDDRPKRKAATVSRKNPVIEDALDDSDVDGHYKHPGDKSSSEDDSLFSDNNNEVAAPAKKSRM